MYILFSLLCTYSDPIAFKKFINILSIPYWTSLFQNISKLYLGSLWNYHDLLWEVWVKMLPKEYWNGYHSYGAQSLKQILPFKLLTSRTISISYLAMQQNLSLYGVERCTSVFNVHTNSLWIVFKCRFWLSRTWGAVTLRSQVLPAPLVPQQKGVREYSRWNPDSQR